MNIELLKEKIAKNYANIEKLKKSIATREQRITTLGKQLEVLGVPQPLSFNTETFRKNFTELLVKNPDLWSDIYWVYCDIDDHNEYIQKNKVKIEKANQNIAKYENQLKENINATYTYNTDVPDVLKQLEQQLVVVWDDSDIMRRDTLRHKLKSFGYTEFCKNHTNADYQFCFNDDVKIHSDNVAEARALVLDLYYRVKDITGNIIDWSHLTRQPSNDGGVSVLNGVVIGEKGSAEIRSILAGGYNIQKLHMRVLVNKI